MPKIAKQNTASQKKESLPNRLGKLKHRNLGLETTVRNE